MMVSSKIYTCIYMNLLHIHIHVVSAHTSPNENSLGFKKEDHM